MLVNNHISTPAKRFTTTTHLSTNLPNPLKKEQPMMMYRKRLILTSNNIAIQ